MIVGIAGAIGSGKTCLLTRYAYLSYRRGRHILSNYHLKFPHRYFNDVADLFSDSSLKNVFLAIDEMQILLDCRVSASKRNRLISYFILQTRKRNVDLYFTTQDIAMLDLRLLRHMDAYIKLRNVFVYDKHSSLVKKHPYLFFLRIHDYRDSDNIVIKDFYFDGRKFFDLYDTSEIIAPL